MKKLLKPMRVIFVICFCMMFLKTPHGKCSVDKQVIEPFLGTEHFADMNTFDPHSHP